MRVPQNLYLFDAWGVQGKGSFYADAMGGDAADCEVGVGASTPANAHHHTAYQLDPLPIALDDAKAHLHVVADAQLRQVRLDANVILLLLFLYRTKQIAAHGLVSFLLFRKQALYHMRSGAPN